jgi:hypothetical protein
MTRPLEPAADRPHRAVADRKGVEMRSTPFKLKLAGLAVAAMLAAPSAHAMPIDPEQQSGSVSVAPPPSSIAASAGEEYAKLRAPDTTVASQPVADEPSAPGGFDLVSAAIGAAATAGLSLLAIGLVSMRRPTRRVASA